MEQLEWLIRRETFVEILSLLTPLELFIAECRADGMSDSRIAARLGMSRRTISQLMIIAKRRIVWQMPEAADWIEGRKLRPRRNTY